MNVKLTVLKLGGSVVTIKEKPFTPNKRAIRRLSKEIKRADVDPLIVTHGGGSFGHPVAKKYGIKEGFKGSYQIMGFSKTHQAMISLNKIILDALIQRKIPAVTVQPSAFITTNNGRIQHIETNTILKLLEWGIIPVLYGDVVIDLTLGFTILSGDQLVSSLAMKLDADRIIMGIDVDGLYTTDPKVDPSARHIQSINLNDLTIIQKNIKGTQAPDVTGGMLGKILELTPAVKTGIKAMIVNAAEPDNIYRALTGKKVKGTVITR